MCKVNLHVGKCVRLIGGVHELLETVVYGYVSDNQVFNVELKWAAVDRSFVSLMTVTRLTM